MLTGIIVVVSLIRLLSHLKNAKVGVDASVGSVGDSYDNVLVVAINGFYKTEVIRRCDSWPNIDAVEYVTLEWIVWFNHRWQLKLIRDVPSTELEQAYYRKLEESAMAA